MRESVERESPEAPPVQSGVSVFDRAEAHCAAQQSLRLERVVRGVLLGNPAEEDHCIASTEKSQATTPKTCVCKKGTGGVFSAVRHTVSSHCCHAAGRVRPCSLCYCRGWNTTPAIARPQHNQSSKLQHFKQQYQQLIKTHHTPRIIAWSTCALLSC